jgi:hypothetical protein
MKLIRYAELLGFDECGLRGVMPDPVPEQACLKVWDPIMRNMLLTGLAVAQSKIEDLLHYPLSPKFICGERFRWNKQPGLIGPTRWRYVRALGIVGYEDISISQAVDLSPGGVIEDPVMIAVATTVTEPCEIYLSHRGANGGAEIEVNPDTEIEITGGALILTLPRCRLVNPTLPVPDGGLDYSDDDNFVDVIDIRRRYVDTSDIATLIYDPNTALCEAAACNSYEQPACGTIRDERSGDVFVAPATYVSGAWSGASLYGCYYPKWVKLNYLANYDGGQCDSPLCTDVPLALEMAIIRLGHSEMPYAPCGCEVHNVMWTNDMMAPAMMTPDMMNPFGNLAGQLYAWRTSKMYILGDGGAF